MRAYISGLIMFTLGIGSGVLLVNEALKSKYNNDVQYEVNLLRNIKPEEEEVVIPTEIQVDNTINIDPAELEHPLDEEDLTYRDADLEREVFVDTKKPYIIQPWQFYEENLTYEKVSLMLYADMALTNDQEELLHIESTFGDVAPDVCKPFSLETVFVRDNRNMIDYEVEKTSEIYSEANL